MKFHVCVGNNWFCFIWEQHFAVLVCSVSTVVKMVNQLLARVHSASSAEAMALGARLSLNTRTFFDAIINNTGSLWYVI